MKLTKALIFTPLLFTFLFFGLIPKFSWAQGVIEVQHFSSIEDTRLTAELREKIFEEAIQEVSFSNIEAMIGSEKTQRNREVIENRIVRNSGRYVLSIQAGSLVREGPESKMEVLMRVSLSNLRALLLDEGLLYETEGPPKVLPAVLFSDRVNSQNFGWWFQERGSENRWISDLTQVFEGQLKEELREIGFYGKAPVGSNFSKSVPEAYRVANIQRGDALFLGEFFKSSIILRGHIAFRNKPLFDNVYTLDVRVEALHSQNGRVLGEVVRTYETGSGHFQTVVERELREKGSELAKDIASQLSDAWRRGTFGASLLQLTVNGSLSPKELDNFKESVLIQLRDVKGLRERRIRSQSVTFEMDSSAVPQQLAQAFRNAQINSYMVEVSEVKSDGLTLNVRAL